MRDHALALALVLVALAPRSASAHGPAPVALEVLAHDGTAPIALRTNVGLAVAAGDGSYDYVCPSRWDGNPVALAAASADGAEVLVHSAGIAYLSRDGGCTFAPLTGDDLYVVGAAWTPEGFLLIAEEYPEDLDPSRSHLSWVVDGGLFEAAIELPGAVDGVLGTPRGFVVSGHAPIGFVANETGVLATFETTASLVTPRAAAGDDVWLRTTEGGTVSLARVRSGAFEASGSSATTVQGPVRVGERWVALFDGDLFEHAGDWRALGEVSWTCLRPYGDRNFACSLDVLRELSAGTSAVPEATPVFSMLQLGPPRACGDEDAREACGLDWAHFGSESGWVDSLPATSPTTPRRVAVAITVPLPGAVPAGCSVSARASGLAPLLVALPALVLRRRALRRTRA